MSCYPLDAREVEEQSRDYRDDAAAELYTEAGGAKLAAAHAKLCRALDKQGAKLEEFHSTPYTEEHAKTLSATMDALRLVEAQLERWHCLIYPNQDAPVRQTPVSTMRSEAEIRQEIERLKASKIGSYEELVGAESALLWVLRKRDSTV